MSDAKRFFELSDGGCVFYSVVATDLEHAKTLLRTAECTFGQESVSMDQAQDLVWSELTMEQVAKKTRCHTEDDRGIIKLADANIGEWFCSEF